eukprot:IDg17850t1
MGKKDTAKVTGKGNVIVALNVGSRRQMCIFKDVLHVPDLGYQLLSVSTMDKLGLEISFKHGRCCIKSDSKTIASGTLSNGLYNLDLAEDQFPPDKALVASLQRWHERLAHVGKAG